MESSLLVDRLSALAADPHAPRLAARHVVYMMADAHGLAAAWAHQHHVGSRKGAFAFRDAALDLLGGIGPRMTLDHHGVLHQYPPGGPVDAQNASGHPFVAAGDYLHGVFLPQVDAHRLHFFLCNCHQITSGASETIFMNFFSRSSLATGPNTRVPTGSPTSLISTAALLSNRMYVPSFRRVSLRMRTITQRTTLPFFTCDSGVASFTAAVTTSPNPARSPRSPPRGNMQDSLRAPELSAT